MPLTDASHYFDQFKIILLEAGKDEAIRKKFNLIKENSVRVRFMSKLFEEFDDIIEEKLRSEKNNAIAESCRTKGNQFYKKSQFLDALSSYNESLCFAEPGSKNIALAYANRSAVYCEMKVYDKCLKNIELAKLNHYPNPEKLNKREETCLQMINNKSKLSLSNEPIGADYLKLSHPANKKLPFIADCLELKTDKKYGRHIITKTALQPGDVVCCEEPFMKHLEPSHRFKYCATCLNDNFLDLFPCSDCTATMFCSEECEKVGQEKFHKFECPIIDKLDTMRCMHMALQTFFEALYVCDGKLEDLKALIYENQGSSLTLFDYECPAVAKTVLKAIDALSSNENKRDRDEMFQRAGAVAVICDLFLKHSKLREILVSKNDEDFFYSFIFKQYQISECNYHGISNGVDYQSEVESNRQYGTGSFPFCSLLNHSCASNIFRIPINCKNYLIIIRPIAAGGQLFDDYGYNHYYETLQQRQTSLINQYKFKCSCEACEGNYPLDEELESKDLSFLQLILDDAEMLIDFNLNIARKKFKSYCDNLKRMDSNYPSAEANLVREGFKQCIRIFSISSHIKDIK